MLLIRILFVELCSEFCHQPLDSPGFNEPFHEAYMGASEFGQITFQLPWVTPREFLAQVLAPRRRQRLCVLTITALKRDSR